MVPPTRRRVLHGAVGLATALAGCGDFFAAEERTRPTPTASERTFADSETDPETVALRTDTDRPPVWFRDEDETGDERPTEGERAYFRTNGLLDGSEAVQRLGIADVSGADGVRQFLDQTDFDSETVYTETRRLPECYRLQLCRVAWTRDSIRTDYVRTLRPYDERCRDDRQVYETRFVRIPAALDADTVRSFASSGGTGGCDRPGRAKMASGDETNDASANESGTTAAAGEQ
ncbi:hypothetical protein [Haloarcula marina]|uniref:hypothetical protein n=1 Tax=Haloarcula marina TaxID=2961574 RepID=UPI0020B70219|nr:hypothetical protein [Halomicroarcula marina]